MDAELLSLLKLKISEILPEIIELRHQIHKEPEIGLTTAATRQKVLERLSRTNLTIQNPLLENDLLADLDGHNQRRICLRADTDALAIREQTGLEYQSQIPGAMHACGHDGHTAILTGTALVLNALQEYLPISVRFIFQPGEEMLCAGKTLVSKGACDGSEAAFALHNWPGLPIGRITSKTGPLFAAAAMFTIELTGHGCHGAMPEQ